MHAFKQHSSRTPGRLTILAVAIASALAVGQAQALPPQGSLVDTSISSFENGAIISGTSIGIKVTSTGKIGTLNNSGTISGSRSYGQGINNLGTVDTLTNSGNINGGQLGIYNYGTITALNNSVSDTINGGSYGIYNAGGVAHPGTIGTLNNSGTISSDNAGIENHGTITALNNVNGGTISGGQYGIYNNGGVNTSVAYSGAIGTLSNSGTISGGQYGIYNDGGTNGSGVAYSGTIGTLSNSGIISSDNVGIENNGGTNGGVAYSGTIGTLNNSGTISGGIGISGSGVGIENYGTINSLNNAIGGTVSGVQYGIYNHGGSSSGSNVYSATIGTLNNSGTISSDNVGIENNGTINSLSNSGTISGGAGRTGIVNGGSITTLTNNGLINGGWAGIYNPGAITGLNNSGTISGSYGIYNSGTVGQVTNSGTISGGGTGIDNEGSIGTLTNSGTISGGHYTGIYNEGSIGTLTNSGTISGGHYTGIYNNGSIGTLGTLGMPDSGIINSGTISGYAGIYNDNEGSIVTLNNSGTISGVSYAIYNRSSATLGTVTNSGTIAGTIENDSSNVLTINGGSGSTFGRLTGSVYDDGTGSYVAGINIGQINNPNSKLTFGSGNLILNDNVFLDGNTLSNDGATLQVNNQIIIDGNYHQGTAAKLILGVNSNADTTTGTMTDSGYGRLVVSGSANIDSGSSVGLKPLGAYGFAQGQRYVVVQANTTGTNYNASTLHYTAAGYNVTGSSVVDSGNTDLLLTLGSAISTVPVNKATTSGGAATLTGLFNYGGYNASLMNLFNAAAALDSPAAANHAAAQLSPTATLSAATQASTASTVQVLNVTTAHVDGLRTAQNGNNGSGVATGESASSTGLWGQGFGGTSRLGERDDVAGYHAHYSGMLLGADAALNDSWRAGGVFSYTKTTVNNDGSNSGSSADVKSYGLFGYASYTGSPWYVDMSLGAIQHQYDTTRDVSFPGFSSTAKGQHDGMQYIASVLAGYPIDLGPKMANTVLTPIAGLTYSTLRQDSYTEKDGGGAALHVSANNVGSLKSDLGAKLERTFGTSYGNVVPSAQLTYRHEYHDNAPQSVSNYAADTSGATSFASTGAKAIADTGVMALGVTLVRSQNLSIGAKYTLEAASGYAANTGDVQVRWDF